MKTRLTMLKLLLVLCSICAITSAFGQPVTYVWTNQFPGQLAGAGDMNQATNWDPNVVGTPMVGTPDANGEYGDLLIFDGRTTGPLSITESGGTMAGYGGQAYPAGLRIRLTSNQTNSVTIYSVISVSGGLRMNYFTVDPGAGPLILGDNSVNCFDMLGGEQNGQVFGFTNNSTKPCVLNETLRWRMGGAGFHPHVFAGTGDWIVNNHMRSANSSSIGVQKEGSGTLTWTGTNTLNANYPDAIGSPARFNSGTTILKSSDILNAAAGGPAIVNNGTLLKFDYTPAPGIITTPDSIPGNISGTGPIQVNAGTITLAGASTFSGNISLTGGQLIAGAVETAGISGPLGQNGIISFNGGTLGWNLANAYDYSPRFDTTPGQVINIDTGGSSPTLATGLTGSGTSLNKTGGGTLTLAGANTYTGPTTVGAGGQLLFQGTMSGTGNITVADSAALGVVENGSQITPNTLTLGSITGATLEFNNVTNKTFATLAPTNLVANGPVTINVNSGRFRTIGEIFPLLKWTTGNTGAVTLAFLSGAGGHLITNLTIDPVYELVIDDPPFIWTDLAADGTWNTTSIDWLYSGANVAWTNGHYALLDDSAPNGNVTLSGTITPTNVTINNSALLAYAITNSAGNVLGGAGSLSKYGSGTLTLPGGANTYTGVTTVGGGVLGVSVLASGGSASDIGAASTAAANIVLNGGTLQYTGPGVAIDRLFSVGQNGGTIDSEGAAALVFNNTGSLGMSGNGPRTLTLTGPNAFGDTIACAITNHPAGTSLKKTGAGTWILTGTNTYANGTTILEGTLQIGASPSGTIGNGNISTAAGTGIDFLRTGTLTVPGAISGGCVVTNDGTGTVILANNNSYTGGTVINAGTLQVGTGGGIGSLYTAGNIVNNGLLDIYTSGTFNYGSGADAGVISGTGNVIVRGGGTIKAIGNNTYTGWTQIGSGTTFTPHEGQDGGLASSVVTNNGTLRLIRQDAVVTYGGPIVGSGKLQIGNNNINVGVITLTGTNTYTGGTYIGGNTLVLGDAATALAGSIPNDKPIVFTNNWTIAVDNPRTLIFNRPAGDDFTFSGTITTNFAAPQVNLGIVQLNGGANVTFTGNNTYGGGTVISLGTLQVGNGGATGTIGSGPVTDDATLIFNRSGSLSVPGVISGVGSVQQIGPGTVTLGGINNTYTGSTTISNGVLVFTGSSVGGDLNVSGGTLAEGGAGVVGTLTVGGNMNITNGTVLAWLNKSLSPPNTTYDVAGAVNYTGGTLKLFNVGPDLAVGDKFFIFTNALYGFTNPVIGGAAMTIVPVGGFTVNNNLGLDGSVTVASFAAPGSNKITATRSGAQVNLSWPAGWTGMYLQVQTNALTKGLSSNWVTIPGSDAGNTYSTTVKTNACVFYRLVPYTP